MPEFFPGVDVGKVDFNGWNSHSRDRVTQRDTGMGISCGIDDNDIKLPLGLLDPANQLAFQIGLPEINSHLQPAARLRTLASISASVARP